MPERPQFYSFRACELEAECAHDGAGNVLTRRVRTGSPTTACSFIDLTIVPAACSIGLHTHTEDNEETYVIIDGQGEMQVDGQSFAVGPGDVVVNRPGGTHGLRNTGDAPLRLVVIEVKVP